MGTTQSYLSPEVLVTAAVVAGAVGFGYNKVASPSSPAESPTLSDTVARKGKKGKKKTTVVGAAKPPDSQVSVMPFPAVVPGQFDDEVSDSSPSTGLEASALSSKAKKGKKNKNKTGNTAGIQEQDTAGRDSPVEKALVSPAAVVTLAGSNISPPKSAPNTKKKKKRQTSSQDVAKSSASSTGPTAATAPAPPKADSSTRKLETSTASLASLATESDEEWTRVSRRVQKPDASSATGGLSDVGQITTTETSSSVDNRTEEGEEEEEEEEEVSLSGPGERHPLSKRLLPKPRKTGVEDMLAISDYPSYSRVMRVQPGDKPAAGFSWGDYEDVVGGDNPGGEIHGTGGADADGEDDGWGVVKRGGRPKNTTSSSQPSLSASRTASASETMTKRQRQNAAKRDAQKSAKADAERERLATLAKHKRELERAKIDAQYAKGGSKATSGGMQAGIDEKGKLVWE
jgi:hypothetical protein